MVDLSDMSFKLISKTGETLKVIKLPAAIVNKKTGEILKIDEFKTIRDFYDTSRNVDGVYAHMYHDIGIELLHKNQNILNLLFQGDTNKLI